MAAYDLALQNFAVAEHLLQFYELFNGLKEWPADEEMRLAICRKLQLANNTTIVQAVNDQMILCAKSTAPIPSALLFEGGINFLLRQSVVVACTALESFFWDSLRENVLTIIKARRQRADKEIRELKLTLDDYLSIQNYTDPDERLKQIILKNFERGTLYSSDSIDRIAGILTVKNIWDDVGRICGRNVNDLKQDLNSLINRRNQIAHRADRPNDGEVTDGHGLRVINSSWIRTRLATVKSLVDAANQIFTKTIEAMQNQLSIQQEQELAKQTMQVSRVMSTTELEATAYQGSEGQLR